MKPIAKIVIIFALLLPLPFQAESFLETDLDDLMTEKRALVKKTMQLTEKESAGFWPLYDEIENYQKSSIKRTAALIRSYLQERKNMSDKKAKAMVDEVLQIQADDLKFKQKYVRKLRGKLTDKKVFQYLLVEERIDAGFNSLIAQELPELK